MFKRLISGIFLVCIVAPAFFWVKDRTTESMRPDSLASKAYDTIYGIKSWFVDMTADAHQQEIKTEYDRIARDIAETESLLKELESTFSDSDRTRDLRSDLAALLQRRERALAGKNEQLLSLNAERLEAEKYFLVHLRSKTANEEWNSMARIARIEASMSDQVSRSEQSRIAAIVNDFVDAVATMDLDSVRSLSTPELGSELSLARIRSMRRNTPAELTSGFELRRTGNPKTIEVWSRTRIGIICSTDGKWMFAEAWN